MRSAGLRLALTTLEELPRKSRPSSFKPSTKTFTRTDCLCRKRLSRHSVRTSRGQSELSSCLVVDSVAEQQSSSRFLADRFVEGICPRCGYDVSSLRQRLLMDLAHLCLSYSQDARGDQCDKCAGTFSSPTELEQPRCKRDKTHKLTTKPSTHSCLRLDLLQPRLEEFLQKTRKENQWANNAVILANGEIVEPRMKEA